MRRIITTFVMLVHVKFPIAKNGGAWIFLIYNLSVSLSGAIIITPSSSEVNTETKQLTKNGVQLDIKTQIPQQIYSVYLPSYDMVAVGMRLHPIQ
jgi:hypothetical protein